jgi:hypothetical protein
VLNYSASSLALAAAIVISPLAAHADAPQMIPYSVLLTEIKEDKVEQLTFAADEKSVILKTADGTRQTVAVMPSAQVKNHGVPVFEIVNDIMCASDKFGGGASQA